VCVTFKGRQELYLHFFNTVSAPNVPMSQRLTHLACRHVWGLLAIRGVLGAPCRREGEGSIRLQDPGDQQSVLVGDSLSTRECILLIGKSAVVCQGVGLAFNDQENAI
jgi:hypothetical protein